MRIAFWLVFFIRTFQSLAPREHIDALYYHLPLSKLWLESGLLHAYENLCNALYTGLFDHLYIIPHLIWGPGVLSQSVCQAMHWFCSMGLSAIFLRKWVGEKWGDLAGIALLTHASGLTFFFYAKNDGPVALMTLLTTYAIQKHKNPWVIGFLMGLIVLIKINGLIIVAVLGIYYCFLQRNIIWQTILAGFLTCSPLLIRNYLYLGTPFYPGLLSSFPGDVAPYLKEVQIAFMSSPVTLTSIIKNLQLFIGSKIIYYPLFAFILWKGDYKNNIYIKLSIFIFILMMFINGGVAEPRFLFAPTFLLVTGIWQVIATKDYFPKKYVLVLTLILLLVDSKLDLAFKQFKFYGNLILQNGKIIPTDFSERASFWKDIPASLPDNLTYIISMQHHEIYYAPAGVRVHTPEGVNSVAKYFPDCSKSDWQKLNLYRFAILGPNLYSNFCVERIRSTWVQINQMGDYQLFAR